VSLGLGLSSPLDETVRGQKVQGSGEGVWVAAEYIERRNDWLAPHVYSGVVVTTPQHDCGPMVSPCDVSARVFFMGAKMRLTFPIPYVAPFLELGLGASLGAIRTKIGDLVDVDRRGVMYHIPFGIGLAVGRRHQVEIALEYLYYPEQVQFNGAAALGMTFTL
jgi:hypothetical protein